MVAAFLAVALLSTILMALPQDQVVSCAPPYAGIVTAIEGTALLLNTNGHQRQLTPQNGNGTPLQVGQQVKCATACRVQLKLCHVAEPVEIVSTRWYADQRAVEGARAVDCGVGGICRNEEVFRRRHARTEARSGGFHPLPRSHLRRREPAGGDTTRDSCVSLATHPWSTPAIN